VRVNKNFTLQTKTMNTISPFNRVILIVLDSVGIGAMPDAEAWGDAGADTLGHILAARQVALPNLAAYGLGNIRALEGVPPTPNPRASFGRCALRSNGKDTTTGHWELAGIVLEKAFPTYPQGFPPDIINRFIGETKAPGVLGNRAASGTEIIAELGAEHLRTGAPIVYTSADSVFQIAAHEDVIPIARLYEMCEIAREILQGEHEVGRVIARPFAGASGDFKRTERRKDYAVAPPRPNLNVSLAEANLDVVSVGKVASVFDEEGFTAQIPAKNNEQSVDGTLEALRANTRGLIFANLVDFDMLYGHRRDIEGYARALEDFDARLPEIEAALRDDDLLIITADHGNDPAFKGSDHTREYTPLLVFGRQAQRGRQPRHARFARRHRANYRCKFWIEVTAGESFLRHVKGQKV
jgi:phosphopentomutase